MSYNTRIKLKSDTESNWLSQDPVLLDGEVAIVKCDGGITRKKIGDGSKKFSELAYDESKSLGLASAAVGQIPKVKAVDSNGVPTEWEPAELFSGGGTGSMKKLTFTGAATGEYDGTTDVSVDIPSDVYVVQLDTNNTLVNDFDENDFDELASAINSHKIIMLSLDGDIYPVVDTHDNFGNLSNPKEIVLICMSGEMVIYLTINKNTKKCTINGAYVCLMEISDRVSGVVYFDKDTGLCSAKDSISPIATTSTAGTIKVGNGLSISDDGTLSVTTATYYTGTADPVDTLGADGDLYLKTEG